MRHGRRMSNQGFDLFKKRVAEHLLDVRRLFPWVCSAKRLL
jgi:hypothetical protein